MSLDCPNCGKMLPPMTVNVSEVAHLLGESRWTAAGYFRRFCFPWRPKGRKGKKALLQDVIAWFRQTSASNGEQLRALLDGRAAANRAKKVLA